MPILMVLGINGAVIFTLIYLTDISIFSDFLEVLNPVPFFLGLAYLLASGFMGGMVRMVAGGLLVLMSLVDFGLSATTSSALQAAIAIVGALTPF